MPISSEQLQELFSKALESRSQSYSPYSKFRVGACLLSLDGSFISGANVENASYGGAICAERTAIVKAVTSSKRSFLGLAVSSDVEAPISPCGICRQVLREFCALDMPIFLLPAQYSSGKTKFVSIEESKHLKDGNFVIETTLGEILPISFGPEDLGNVK